MPTIRTLLADARQALQQRGLPADEGRLEARLLLLQQLQVDHAWLLAHEGDSLAADSHAGFQALLQRRLNGEPIAHILGQREFYGLMLKVTPDTLIPRPDTETLVEAALAKIPDLSFVARQGCPAEYHDGIAPGFKVLDLGTGTGAIALAIASQRPHAEVLAVDASIAALAVASENARSLHLRNVRFLQSDWFSALPDIRFDLVVSNPPYIADQDPHLSQGDLRFEPLEALASGTDGLDDLRQIIAGAPRHLNRGGWLMLEHGYDQASRVGDLLQRAGFSAIGQARDLAGIVRVSYGQLT
ncbi:MAG TPA: peptide chain release factor N(5)-glutamine methyltransferase [Methylophilaceae bacterium]|nr:peptide chain release factor N(5)-glutamine methyltransferase [Methylophilaceae bacterium]